MEISIFLLLLHRMKSNKLTTVLKGVDVENRRFLRLV